MQKRTMPRGNPPHSDVRDFLLPWSVVGLSVSTNFLVSYHWRNRNRAKARVCVWNSERKVMRVAEALGTNAVEATAKAVLKALKKSRSKMTKPLVHYSLQPNVLEMRWGAFVTVEFEKDEPVECGTVGHFPDPANAVAHAVVKVFNKYTAQKGR